MRFVAGVVRNLRQAGMQAFVDQKSQGRVSLGEISRQGA
jgi:hypothetical protein